MKARHTLGHPGRGTKLIKHNARSWEHVWMDGKTEMHIFFDPEKKVSVAVDEPLENCGVPISKCYANAGIPGRQIRGHMGSDEP